MVATPTPTLASAVLALLASSVPAPASAQMLALDCDYRARPDRGLGLIRANYDRRSTFEVNVAARRAAGGIPRGRPDGSWEKVFIDSRTIKLVVGHDWACSKKGGKGQIVLIDRYTGQSTRDDCDGTGREWWTLHWTGTCRRAQKRF